MPTLTLPRELTIHTAAALRSEWLDALAAHAATDPWVVDGADVEEIDTAGVQLLLSLARSAESAGRAWQLAAPSRALAGACSALGVALPPAPANGDAA